ncbi:hypothetical protein N8824_02220 [Candidatus Pelagibacter sp.]|nr:hypothetical protein [Candidatus Pelagibacter sp.]
MFYKKLLLLYIFFLINNCTVANLSQTKTSTFLENSFINKGFALIYDDNLFEEKVISKKIDGRSLVIFQKNLKKNTKVKITNINNNKSIIATVGKDAKYPLFNNAVISIRIADELDLSEKEPYIEIFEILESSMFVAKKAKTFDEEKKVATKAPVNNIIIKNLNKTKSKIENKNDKIFSYNIKIADFYFNDTALVLIDRIKNETDVKDAKIRKITEKKYRVYLGPFDNISVLQKSFNGINILNFENLEIIKND